MTHVTAMILPVAMEEATVEDTINLALKRGLVPCVPANIRKDGQFRVTFIDPEKVPAGWRVLAVKIKSKAQAAFKIEEPVCAA